jgi:hypothetical protein
MSDHYDVNEYLRIYRPTDGIFADEVCISAHGGYEKSYGWATSPAGATVYFYELHGATQANQKSRQIMQGMASKDLSPTSIGCGDIWNYHLAMYELDPEQAPADVTTAASNVDRDVKKAARGVETFGYVLRDVISIRQERLPKTAFPDGIPLSYIFNELDKSHVNYKNIHLCFCRYQFWYPGNIRHKTAVG